ncbi:hypothetical protein RTP6_006924 [Batrachochytrium dendrobatidis]
MKFTDIILVLSVSAVASALVTTPNAETRSHQLSKRSPGKDWEKAVGRESNHGDSSGPGPSNNGDSSEPGPSNDGNSAKSRLDDAKRKREDICDKYHKYKKEFEQDKAALKLEQENMHLNSFGNDYYGSNGDESFARRRKKFLQLKKRCKNAKRQEKDLRKEFEEQSGTGWRGKLERLKKMLTKH